MESRDGPILINDLNRSIFDLIGVDLWSTMELTGFSRILPGDWIDGSLTC